jgi:hypothetical protein
MRAAPWAALLASAAIAAVVAFDLRSYDGEFDAFLQTHPRPYSKGSAEYERRRHVFTTNRRRHTRMTALSGGLTQFGVTNFADWSAEEFRARLLTHRAPIDHLKANADSERARLMPRNESHGSPPRASLFRCARF